MTSMITNSSALAALQTLWSINSSLADTQGRVSSGLRVAVAADNAAYWSISTTMRSDNMAIAAVSDALGLGAAKVDAVYAGLWATADALSEIKARVVAAAEEGTDSQALQAEIDQFKQQVMNIASSSSFSGENWLSTEIVDIYTSGTSASITSAYVRDEDGVARVRRMQIPLLGTALFNSTGGGILQADDRSIGDIGGMRGVTLTATGNTKIAGFEFEGPLVFVDDTTAITFDITLDGDDPANTSNPQPGQTTSVTINRSLVDQLYPGNGGVVSYIGEWSELLEESIGRTEIYVPYNHVNLGYSMHTREKLARGASVFITNVTSTLADGGTGGLKDMATPVYGTRPQRTLAAFTSGFTLHPSNRIDIPITVNGASYTASITRDLVDSALGTQTGTVADRDDFIAVLNMAFANAGAGILASASGGSGITFSVDSDLHPESGRKATFEIGPASDLVGEDVVSADLMELDISGDDADIGATLSDVEVMIGKVTSSAARMGALSSRIETLMGFTYLLMSSVDSGIGRLVDADMNEESSRLKALQTQEQLAIQSLQIANSESQNILSLFR